MATTSYGTPYVEAADLVSGYPGTSLSLADRVDDISFKGNGINDQTGTTYTLDILDAGKSVTLSNSSAVTVTIPTNTAEPIEIGSMIRLYNKGAGSVTIQPAGTVTLEGGNIVFGQYGGATIVKIATNTWSPLDTGGVWTTYTPTWTNLTVGNGTLKAAYEQIGKTVRFRIGLLFGSTTTVTGRIDVSLPVTAKSDWPSFHPFLGYALDNSAGLSIAMFASIAASRTAVYADVWAANTNYVQGALSSGTVPFTWATSDQLSITGEYEAA